MDALNNKRARLQHELQAAYEAWMLAREGQTSRSEPAEAVDISGSPDVAKAQWFEYLAAKQRLVVAYAEVPLAA
jgi:hypothetical protein